MSKFRLEVTLATLLLLGSSTGLADSRSPFWHVQQLLQQGKAAAAYELLLELESRYGGNADYNYLLGVASLQTAHYSQARSALERTILLEPDNAGAYLDLAIVEVELRNYATAERLLSALEHKFTPPKAIQEVIRLYRTRIQQALTPHQIISGSLFASSGHSSNVNNGTDKSLINLDLGNGSVALPVSDSSKSSPDSYLEAGATLNYGIAQGNWRYQLVSALQKRDYQQLSEFNTTNLLIGANTRTERKNSQLEAGIYYSVVWLDQEDYQSSTTVNFNYSHQLKSNLRLSSQLRLSQARYIQTPDNDLNQTEITLAASYPFSLLNTSNLIQASLRGAQGDSINNRAGGNQQRYRFNIAWINQPSTVHLIRLNSFITRDEDSQPYNKSLFGPVIRETDKIGIDLSYSYFFNPSLSATVAAGHSQNSSTIDLFTTNSTEFSLKLNYTF